MSKSKSDVDICWGVVLGSVKMVDYDNGRRNDLD